MEGLVFSSDLKSVPIHGTAGGRFVYHPAAFGGQEPLVWSQKAFARFHPFMVKPDGGDGGGDVVWCVPPRGGSFPQKDLAKKTYDSLLQLVTRHPGCHFDPSGFVLSLDKEVRLLPTAICSSGKNLLEWFNVEEIFELGEEQMEPITEEEADFMRNRDPVLRAYLNRIGLTFERFAVVQRHSPEFERHLRLARCRINRKRYDVYMEQAKGELPTQSNPVYCQILHDMRDPLVIRAMNGQVNWELNEKDKLYLEKWQS